MNPTYISTGMAYGKCVDQRHSGASRAVEYGAIAVIVRSMTLKFDKNPHTGSMSYMKSNKKIPAVAISTKDAHDLSEALNINNVKNLSLELSCKQLADTISYNVIGEVKGSKYPEEIILVGGHLDSWDIGEGAHDDGAGVVQSLQVLETFKKMNIQSNGLILGGSMNKLQLFLFILFRSKSAAHSTICISIPSLPFIFFPSPNPPSRI